MVGHVVRPNKPPLYRRGPLRWAARPVQAMPMAANPHGYNARMNSHSQSFHAVVVGGGLVGKTAPLALTQAGLRTALLASPPAPLAADAEFDSRIYALSSSS